MGETNEVYTHGHHPVILAAHAERTADEAAAFLLPRLKPGMSLLDVGCGPGSITLGLADHMGPEGSVIGVDSSEEAIAEARRGARQSVVPQFEVASVYDLPFPDGSFDVVFGHQILQHLADPVGALVEIGRVLKPGGLVAMRDADFGSMSFYPELPELHRWLDIYHSVARANGGEPDAGRRLVSWIRSAGFVDAIGTSSTWTYITADERERWARLWASRITLDRFADRAVGLGLCDRSELEEIADGWRTWAAEPDGWFGFIHGEVVAAKPPEKRRAD
jgi:ubiquinone/menaquinone biosynthesis C-methylase UbiE